MTGPAPVVTAGAAAFMRRILARSTNAAAGFRLTVERIGCSRAWHTGFSVAPGPCPGDQEFSVQGVRLLLPPRSPLLRAGVTLDFADGPTRTGLVVDDPQPRRCHCGAHAPRTGAA